ncbi:MAG: hypothetical protein P1U58_19315 [Verrucomicrobiales bacterium]|nr:hypothetical protein [Verrucomicrobiales bacterium]
MARSSVNGTFAPFDGGNAIEPEFIRLPQSGKHCPHSGLSRSSLNELILGNNPPVQSKVLRKPGNIRGIRLIVYRSLMDYLHELEA